ncbi:MAG: amidohydrolase family protein [Desulfatitalea sp.]|nr:amidohydrolase family protein [Desulfatitalea sp.]NNK01628.1 amidohydrolase family protein [Desulfatitalea sp.]
MTIDFHTHIFPKNIRASRDPYFAGEPAFALLYASPKSKMVGADALVKAMDEQQIDLSVTFGFPWQSEDLCRRHNDYVLEAIARYPDRLLGFCCVATGQSWSAREVERCLAAGMAGVGELACYCGDMDGQFIDGMDAVMDLARQYDRPVMVHTNEPVGHPYPGKTSNTLLQIYALVKKYPMNRLVLAHWGGGIFFYTLMKKEVGDVLANVWFDTAASPFLYRPDIYRLALELAGPEKVLFGTDYPLLAGQRYFTEMAQAGLNRDQIRMICHDNAARLLGIHRAAST